jgi:hypothetical protein
VLSQAIVAYALQVVAFEALPGNLEPARRALQPIDELRAAVGRRASRGARGEDVAVEVEDDAEDAEPEAAAAEPVAAVA